MQNGRSDLSPEAPEARHAAGGGGGVQMRVDLIHVDLIHRAGHIYNPSRPSKAERFIFKSRLLPTVHPQWKYFMQELTALAPVPHTSST